MAHDPAPSSDAQDAPHAGGHGIGRYIKVWAVLIACTCLTVWTGYKDLGSVNLPLALCIATLKASLVVWYFMHMREAAGTNRIVFVTSFVFMFVMIFGVFGDLWTRNEMSLPSPHSVPTTEGPEIQVPGETPQHHE